MTEEQSPAQRWAEFINQWVEGMTNQQVSDRTAAFGEKPVSESTIRGWRKGSGKPTWPAVKQFAEAFKIPVPIAYLNAGILGEGDVGKGPDGVMIVINEPADLDDVSTRELWAELGERLSRQDGEGPHPPTTTRVRRNRRRTTVEYDPEAPPP